MRHDVFQHLRADDRIKLSLRGIQIVQVNVLEAELILRNFPIAVKELPARVDLVLLDADAQDRRSPLPGSITEHAIAAAGVQDPPPSRNFRAESARHPIESLPGMQVHAGVKYPL